MQPEKILLVYNLFSASEESIVKDLFALVSISGAIPMTVSWSKSSDNLRQQELVGKVRKMVGL